MFVINTGRGNAGLDRNMISRIQQQFGQSRLTGSHVWRGDLP